MRAGHRGIGRRLLAAAIGALVATATVVGIPTAAPAAAGVPSGFAEVVAFRGLVQPTAVRFAPDGRVFVAEKRGTVQMFDGLGDTTPTRVADLRTEVFNLGDGGLLGLAVDPHFPARPYLYVLYTFDGRIGGTAPTYGVAGADSDACRASATTGPGCVSSGKLARLTLQGTTTTRRDLVHDWCRQFQSHAPDDLVFGPDGALYASAGDAATAATVDYGQHGNPSNPCGDPPAGVGGTMTPPSAEGGALRSQDLRTPGDPVGLDGTVIRVSPDTGLALPDNPAAAAPAENRRRIVAHGLRNPFRMAVRPGTGELWIGDVGWLRHEEVDRVVDPTAAVVNFGWPCYEGPGRQGSYDAAGLRICEDLYAQPAATRTPYFSYAHGAPVHSGDPCPPGGGSSVSGIAFGTASGPYPDAYDGALFLADYVRGCIWVMPAGAGGLPDRTKLRPFHTSAAVPVDLQVSPAGELVYVDIAGGTVRRIVHLPQGTCPPGSLRAEYFANRDLTGTPSSVSCEAAPLSHDWGTGAPAGLPPDGFSARWRSTLDVPAQQTYRFTARADDGVRVFVDGVEVVDSFSRPPGTAVTADVTLAPGPHPVRVEYADASGAASVAVAWAVAQQGTPPEPVIGSPAAGATWQVGQQISFSGSATDADDGPLPRSALRWELVLQHCPSACHAHPQQSWQGVTGGTFTAPDHEYPAHLELRLTATDSDGRSTTVRRRLDPRTVPVTVVSQPTGLRLALGARTAVTPFTTPVVVGGRTDVSAPSPQTLYGAAYTYGRWSDGGARTHTIAAGTAARTLTASYTGPCPVGQYRAQYFANRTLTGAPARSRCEAAPLDRNWRSGAAPGTGADGFSSRWIGTFAFPGGSRTFTAAADDGVRVWLDGALIIDRWTAGAGSTSVTRTVPQGVHTVRVEHWEGTGTARARVTW